MSDGRWLAAAVAAAWVLAGLQVQLLFDLKATATTFLALLVLTGTALVVGRGLALLPALLAGLVGAALVFAAFLIQPVVALAALGLVLAALTALLARPLPQAGAGARLMLAAGGAGVLWPPVLGLLSNTVVELACPGGGVEQACHGFYRVGFEGASR
jgi:hypothetical protein